MPVVEVHYEPGDMGGSKRFFYINSLDFTTIDNFAAIFLVPFGRTTIALPSNDGGKHHTTYNCPNDDQECTVYKQHVSILSTGVFVPHNREHGQIVVY